ncbi:MAG: hypothetical protein ACYCPF_12165, partial [Streptosporangiaceae bacterium]
MTGVVDVRDRLSYPVRRSPPAPGRERGLGSKRDPGRSPGRGPACPSLPALAAGEACRYLAALGFVIGMCFSTFSASFSLRFTS